MKIFEWRQNWWLLLLIGVAAFLSFLPTFKNGFVDWDDTGMFLENFHYRGLGWENIRWMFTTNHYAHYHPITWLTLGLDYVLWGMNPVGYHFQNLLWHTANGVLFFVLLQMLFRQSPSLAAISNSPAFRFGCLAGALFFAIHPLRVESVAWATERRDVVSGFFYLLTLIAYLRAHELPRRRTFWLGVAFVSFVLSFLSKAWGITLPLVLLILDVYPLRRIQFGIPDRVAWRRVLLEKIPFVLIAAVLAVIALRGQQEWGIKAENFGIAKRLMNAAYGLVFYPWKTFVPFGLSPIYPLDPEFNPWETKYILCLLAGITTTAVLFLFRKRVPWLLAGWISYGIIVSPVLGLAQSGEQIAADRYTYLSGLPLAALVGLGAVFLFYRRPTQLVALGLLASGVFLGLGFLTFQQTKVWRDDASLWNQALKVDATNFVAYNGRGRLRMDQGDWDGALEDFNAAIKYNPRRVAPYTNRGMIYHQLGDFDRALADYNASLALKPQAETLNNRGALRETRGDISGALEDYGLAIQANPRFVLSYFNRGRLRQRQGDGAGALEDFSAAIQRQP
ncbi:MAG: tetratricopeptide repeat protein, partial [Limisphaerales bacterium]